MSYTGEQKRAYQRKWIADRRAKWFSDKTCVDCGVTKNLELDHVDPDQKVDHRIWSWSWKRISIETAKCVVRCEPCHLKRTIAQCQELCGVDRYNAAFTNADIVNIRSRYALGGISYRKLAEEYGVDHKTIYFIVKRETWAHV